MDDGWRPYGEAGFPKEYFTAVQATMDPEIRHYTRMRLVYSERGYFTGFDAGPFWNQFNKLSSSQGQRFNRRRVTA
jgi:hypothetical protein